MHSAWKYLNVAVALIGPQAKADSVADTECQSTGIGFTNGGSYLIDVNSPGNFTFVSQFSGMPNASRYRLTAEASLLSSLVINSQ